MNLTVEELAKRLGGVIICGEGGRAITGFASLDAAEDGDVSFLANPKYRGLIATTKAGAILLPKGYEDQVPPGLAPAFIAVENPSDAFAQIVADFGPPPREFVPGARESAAIHPDADVDLAAVAVGENAVIEAGAKVGAGAEIRSGAVVAAGAVVGRDCLLHPNSVVADSCVLGDRVILQPGAVVGSDGFGYDSSDGTHQKIPQTGIVELKDDVELGANVTIDRARFGKTVIGAGTKLDNLVHIAHNVVVGEHCLMIALTGVAGSAKLGDGVVLAAQTGVAGHLDVASGVTLAARGGITKPITEPGTYMGFPAVPVSEGKRHLVAPRRVPKIEAKLKALEQRIEELEQGDSPG